MDLADNDKKAKLHLRVLDFVKNLGIDKATVLGCQRGPTFMAPRVQK